MRPKRLIWQLFPTYLAIILLCLLVNGWLTTRIIRQSYLEHLTADLKARSALVGSQLRELPSSVTPASLDSLCKHLGSLSSMRITLIDSAGRVLGDSHENPSVMENHADRPEIRSALLDSMGTAIRYSPTLKKKMLYLAVPLREPSGTLRILRVALPMSEIDHVLYRIYGSLALVGALIALAGVGFSYGLSWRISRPLREMRNSARSFMQGDFNRRVLVPQSEELGALATALNEMAQQLSAKIGDVTRQRNELEALLSSMIEGVIAVDADERIISANLAARSMLNIHLDHFQGRLLQEAALIPDFQRFVSRMLANRQNLEEEMALHGGRLFVRIQGTMLRDADGRERGALLVLNDITRLRKLENLRREFVANVSHELRTPITTIQGFVETLQEHPGQDPAQTAQFLEIISRNAERLNSIFEDLLSLSKLEQGEERGDIQFELGNIKDVLAAAAQSCEPKASEKGIRIQVDVVEELKVSMNSLLLEQALINLLDNAIKYSSAGGPIHVRAEKADEEIILSVQDSGCGIEAEHLPRIFERFYRVDRNRSRELG
ncbi:MAG TPA: histidine kinase dimerization/phospho-acceptor domain-containing protein, partial [bacterium]